MALGGRDDEIGRRTLTFSHFLSLFFLLVFFFSTHTHICMNTQTPIKTFIHTFSQMARAFLGFGENFITPGEPPALAQKGGGVGGGCAHHSRPLPCTTQRQKYKFPLSARTHIFHWGSDVTLSAHAGTHICICPLF